MSDVDVDVRFLMPDMPAAIDDDRLPRHVFGAQQVKQRLHDILGRAVAPEWGGCSQMSRGLRVKLLRQQDRAGRDRVHANPRREQKRQGAGEVNESCLAYSVWHIGRPGLERREISDVDYRGAVRKVTRSLLRDQERCTQVEVE